jgi:hypothetical protein
MKLLEKNEISKIKGIERKMEIDEGIKLAKRVDTLRELSAKEQTSLSKFRDESLKQIRIEIDSLITERNNLILENKELEKKNNALRRKIGHALEEISNLNKQI